MTNKEAIEHIKEILLKSRSNKLNIVTHGEEIALDLAIKALEERSKVKQIEDNRMVCFDCVHCKVCSLYKKYDEYCDYYEEKKKEGGRQ